ncbi:hypothetical protein [Polyangium fumosum]|nr:hypothetical protein [Polyangium fumosum]
MGRAEPARVCPRPAAFPEPRPPIDLSADFARGLPNLRAAEERAMPLPKSFQNFAEFEREIIRAGTRVNLSLEDIVEDTSFEEEIELDQDDDPFASMRDF